MLNLNPCELTELPTCMCACRLHRKRPLAEIRLSSNPTDDEFKRLLDSMFGTDATVERLSLVCV